MRRFAGFTFADPAVAVYSNVTGKRIVTGKEARELCGKQLVSMVRWVDVQESLLRGRVRQVPRGRPRHRAHRSSPRASSRGALLARGDRSSPSARRWRKRHDAEREKGHRHGRLPGDRQRDRAGVSRRRSNRVQHLAHAGGKPGRAGGSRAAAQAGAFSGAKRTSARKRSLRRQWTGSLPRRGRWTCW